MKTPFFTRVGDTGKSAMGKKHIPKNDTIFSLLGALDELNSWIGFSYACEYEKKRRGLCDADSSLLRLQEILFIAQAEVGAIGFRIKKPNIVIRESHVRELEKIIFDIDSAIPPITHFVIPGGTMRAASLDVARAVARRAERIAVSFSKRKKLSPEFLRCLNRFSSVLFALARYENFISGRKEKKPDYI